jgi:hypothetical protein
MVDFKLNEYGKRSSLLAVGAADRKRWARVGVRELIRKSGLSQKAVYAIVEGKPFDGTRSRLLGVR